MKAIIVYDSVFGNTEKVAQAVARGLGGGQDVQLVRVSQAQAQMLAGVDVLLVGSPTRQFKATPALTDFLKALPNGSLQGVKVGAFDTRIDMAGVTSWLLKTFVKMFGYAAEPLSALLVQKGGHQVVAPAGFFVEKSEGPLRAGELERAAEWAAGALG